MAVDVASVDFVSEVPEAGADDNTSRLGDITNLVFWWDRYVPLICYV